MLPLIMKASEVIKIVEAEGWKFVRQSGSHKIFKHPNRKGIVVVPVHGKSDMKPGR